MTNGKTGTLIHASGFGAATGGVAIVLLFCEIAIEDI